jgi:hypothetical protein
MLALFSAAVPLFLPLFRPAGRRLTSYQRERKFLRIRKKAPRILTLFCRSLGPSADDCHHCSAAPEGNEAQGLDLPGLGHKKRRNGNLVGDELDQAGVDENTRGYGVQNALSAAVTNVNTRNMTGIISHKNRIVKRQTHRIVTYNVT